MFSSKDEQKILRKRDGNAQTYKQYNGFKR